jgi:hypothetical protein
MNALLELILIGAMVGIALAFVLRRAYKALRGGKPSCCAGQEEPRLIGSASGRPGAEAAGLSAGHSACGGCLGCSPRHGAVSLKSGNPQE